MSNLMDMAAAYPQDPSLKGKDRMFGTFPNCYHFGYRCSVKVTELPDESPEVRDILGLNAFRVGEPAIHISGLDSYGSPVGAQQILALGMYEVIWDTPDGKMPRQPNSSMGGLGFEKPEPCVIVGGGCSFAFFTDPEYSLTLRSVFAYRPVCWCPNGHMGSFTPRDLCERMDEISNRVNTWDRLAQNGQHLRAVRRLLECAIQYNWKIDGSELIRYSRWSYRWSSAEAGKSPI